MKGEPDEAERDSERNQNLLETTHLYPVEKKKFQKYFEEEKYYVWLRPKIWWCEPGASTGHEKAHTGK